MHHENVEEADKPIILFVGFLFHNTIALNEGWLAPRYLIYYLLYSNHSYKMQYGI